ncbi:hypothetical protein [Consotaella aegiceratis]|uniref:hypothetical protein n=1 Tax=Consotaella aegiceratis TaxID=3097961 RepID=UPI002F40AA9E
MNLVAGTFHSLTAGLATAEQVGGVKVVNVGTNSLERVGEIKQVSVGDEFVVTVGGNATLMMNNKGEILITGVKLETKTDDKTFIKAASVHIN